MGNWIDGMTIWQVATDALELDECDCCGLESEECECNEDLE